MQQPGQQHCNCSDCARRAALSGGAPRMSQAQMQMAPGTMVQQPGQQCNYSDYARHAASSAISPRMNQAQMEMPTQGMMMQQPGQQLMQQPGLAGQQHCNCSDCARRAASSAGARRMSQAQMEMPTQGMMMQQPGPPGQQHCNCSDCARRAASSAGARRVSQAQMEMPTQGMMMQQPGPPGQQHCNCSDCARRAASSAGARRMSQVLAPEERGERVGQPSIGRRSSSPQISAMAQPYSPYAPLQSHRSPEAREARRDYFGDTVGKKLIDSYLQPIGSFDGEMLARSEAGSRRRTSSFDACFDRAGQERLAKLMEKQRRPLPQDFMQLDGVPGQRPYHSLQSSPFRSDAKDMPPTLLQNPRAVQAQCGCADCQRHVSAMGSFGDQGLRGMPREGVPLVQGLR
ncbi:unnamed protein product [Durusdinium trenchii]|uniref:Uncharacterized protein n=1 Tax=Durusdinium trenchii TaxID=1381693 RepID=A0ABP0JY28_9DINO